MRRAQGQLRPFSEVGQGGQIALKHRLHDRHLATDHRAADHIVLTSCDGDGDGTGGGEDPATGSSQPFFLYSLRAFTSIGAGFTVARMVTGT